MTKVTKGRAIRWGSVVGVMTVVLAMAAGATTEQDRQTVARLDLEYQAAVKENDVSTMSRILHDDFALVLGDGRTFDRADLLQEARAATYQYEKQDEIDGSQVVRVWGDTAVVTAKLWVKGTANGKAFDRKLWFSDTYIRTSDGWKYVFGQASLPLPDKEG